MTIYALAHYGVGVKTTWSWLGDHLAVDFANTVFVVDGEVVELLTDVDALQAWRDAEPVELPEARVDADDLTGLVALRDAAGRLLRAAARAESLPEPDVRRINEAVRVGGVKRLLTGDIGASRLDAGSGVPALAGVLAAAVVDLLAREDLANLAECVAPGCGQLFHRSRPNQRWCSPGCGNRARVDRHRHRRRSTT